MNLLQRLPGQCTVNVNRREFELVIIVMRTELMQDGEALTCDYRCVPIEIQDTTGTIYVFPIKLPRLQFG